MSRRMALVVVLGVLGDTGGVFTNSASLAQVVDVSPHRGVHVRAPFVRVDVYPHGGVSVRAPFAAVDVPGRRYRYVPGPIVFDGPPPRGVAMPTAQTLAAMNDEQLLRLLRFTANRLNYELGRFDTVARWQRYLQLPDAVFSDSLVTPDERREALESALERFNKTAADPQYRMIAQLPAFVATQAVLTELTSRLAGPGKAGGTGIEDLPLPPPARPGAERPLLPAPSR